MDAPNVLLLDEPTNDLDIDTLRRLEDYLDEFNGIVITVSHDRYFLDRICNKIFAYEGNGHITIYTGNYSDYLVFQEANALAQEAAQEEVKVKETLKQSHVLRKKLNLPLLSKKNLKRLMMILQVWKKK